MVVYANFAKYVTIVGIFLILSFGCSATNRAANKVPDVKHRIKAQIESDTLPVDAPFFPPEKPLTEFANNEITEKVSRYGITIGINSKWGASIFSLRSDTGSVEYINRHDAGRLLQTAVGYGCDSINGCDNPTEAGNIRNIGSPVLEFAMDSGYFYSSVNALVFGENNPHVQKTPILSGTRIMKKVKIINQHRIEYQASFYYAKSLTKNSWIEVPVAFLNDGLFNVVYMELWNDSTRVWNRVKEVSTIVGSSVDTVLNTPCEGRPCLLIAYNEIKKKGFALYRTRTIRGQTITHIRRYRTDGIADGPEGDPCIVISFGEIGKVGVKGTWQTFESYIVLGSLDEIRAETTAIVASINKIY